MARMLPTSLRKKYNFFCCCTSFKTHSSVELFKTTHTGLSLQEHCQLLQRYSGSVKADGASFFLMHILLVNTDFKQY